MQSNHTTRRQAKFPATSSKHATSIHRDTKPLNAPAPEEAKTPNLSLDSVAELVDFVAQSAELKAVVDALAAEPVGEHRYRRFLLAALAHQVADAIPTPTDRPWHLGMSMPSRETFDALMVHVGTEEYRARCELLRYPADHEQSWRQTRSEYRNPAATIGTEDVTRRIDALADELGVKLGPKPTGRTALETEQDVMRSILAHDLERGGLLSAEKRTPGALDIFRSCVEADNQVPTEVVDAVFDWMTRNRYDIDGIWFFHLTHMIALHRKVHLDVSLEEACRVWFGSFMADVVKCSYEFDRTRKYRQLTYRPAELEQHVVDALAAGGRGNAVFAYMTGVDLPMSAEEAPQQDVDAALRLAMGVVDGLIARGAHVGKEPPSSPADIDWTALRARKSGKDGAS